MIMFSEGKFDGQVSLNQFPVLNISLLPIFVSIEQS